MAPPSSAIEIARALIAAPSVTPASGAVFDVLAAPLAAAGFRVERPVFGLSSPAPVENLFARIGTGTPHLVFAGHVDVVPPGDAGAWRHPPYAAVEDGGVLYGRGAVDMKGGVAAFLAAALAFVAEAGPAFGGSLSFLVTGDEEGPSVHGTRELLAWCAAAGERFDAALVGEPTSVALLGDQIKVGRRGSLSATLTVAGRQGHVAYPERAANPVPALFALGAALAGEPLDHGTAFFAASNLEIVGTAAGGRTWNVIPASAELRFNVRYNDLWTHASLAAELEARIARAAAGLGTGLSWKLAVEPASGEVFRTEPGRLFDTLAAAVAEVTGRVPKPSTAGGTSDARFIKDYCPVVELGLVGTTMHQVDERVPVAELEELARIYRRFLDLFFGR